MFVVENRGGENELHSSAHQSNANHWETAEVGNLIFALNVWKHALLLRGRAWAGSRPALVPVVQIKEEIVHHVGEVAADEDLTPVNGATKKEQPAEGEDHAVQTIETAPMAVGTAMNAGVAAARVEEDEGEMETESVLMWMPPSDTVRHTWLQAPPPAVSIQELGAVAAEVTTDMAMAGVVVAGVAVMEAATGDGAGAAGAMAADSGRGGARSDVVGEAGTETDLGGKAEPI